MVALVHPNPSSDTRPRSGGSAQSGRHLTLLVDNGPVAESRRDRSRSDGDVDVDGSANLDADRPRLAVADASMLAPSVLAVVAALVVVLGGFLVIRAAQGTPPATTWDGLEVEASAAPSVQPGDRVVIAQPGDSLWSIAVGITDGDPRPVVDALVEANGGSSVQIGQQIVIPGHLLD